MTPLQSIGTASVTLRDSGTAAETSRLPGGVPAVAQVASATSQVTDKPVLPTQAKQATDKAKMEQVIEDPIPLPRAYGEEAERKPVPPLKSFAQIPTAMMAEITKLREEVAETRSSSQSGRLDPTPMPAGDQAIGGRDAAASQAPTDLKPGSERREPEVKPQPTEQTFDSRTRATPGVTATETPKAASPDTRTNRFDTPQQGTPSRSDSDATGYVIEGTVSPKEKAT